MTTYCHASRCRPATHRDIPLDVCPFCGAEGSLRLHGYYSKDVVSWNGGLPEAGSVPICRTICRECLGTDSLMPTTLVAGSAPTVELCVNLVLWRRRARHAPPEARAWFLSHTSCARRAEADAERLAEAIGVAIDRLAEALATAARDVCALAACFASEHGTAPFSRLPARSEDRPSCDASCP